MRKKTYSLIITIILLALPQAAAGQIAFKSIKVTEKSYYEISPGETASYNIILKNTSDKPIDSYIYAVDATLTSNGSFTVLTKGKPQIGIGKWTTFQEQDPIHLEGKEEKILQYSIAIPPKATPGVYGGGLSAEAVLKNNEQSATVGAIVSTRVVHPIYVKVPGQKITKYTWDSFTHSFNTKHEFDMLFSNYGNTIIKISGTFEITDIFNNTYSIPTHDITLLRDTKATEQASWDQAPFWGIFKAKAKFTFKELDIQKNAFIEIGSQTREISFTIIPWSIIALILTLIAIAISTKLLKKRLFNQYIKKCTKYPVQPTDHLITLAKTYGVNWKKLAKINNIKPPYEIRAGEIILVPPLKKS